MKDSTENKQQVNPNVIKTENNDNNHPLKRSAALKPSAWKKHRIKFGISQTQVTTITTPHEKEKVLPRKPPNTTSFSLCKQNIQLFEKYAKNNKILKEKSQTPTTLHVDPKIELIPNTPVPPPILRSSRKTVLFQSVVPHDDENKRVEKTKKSHHCAFTFNL